jgi:hypothetical protein
MLPGVPATYNNRNAEYPRIHSDGRVTFRVKAPWRGKCRFNRVVINLETTDITALGRNLM